MAVAFVNPMPGNYWKIVFKWNWRNSGWEDIWHYCNTQSSNDGMWYDAANAASILGDSINDSHGAEVKLAGVQITNIGEWPYFGGTQQQSKPYNRAQLGIGVVTRTDPISNNQVGWLFNLGSEQRGIARTWILKGWPAIYVQQGIVGGGFPDTLPGPAMTKRNAILAILAGNVKSAGGVAFTGNFGILGLDKRPAPIGPEIHQIHDIRAVGPRNKLQYLVADNAPVELAQYNRIQVRGARFSCAPGASGPCRLMATDSTGAPAGFVWITTNKTYCCEGTPAVDVEGIVRGMQWGMWKVVSMVEFEVRNRDTGGPFRRTRGRTSKKCCPH